MTLSPLVITTSSSTNVDGLLGPLFECALSNRLLDGYAIFRDGEIVHTTVEGRSEFNALIIFGCPDRRSHLVAEALDRPYTMVVDGASVSSLFTSLTELWQRFALVESICSSVTCWEAYPGLIELLTRLSRVPDDFALDGCLNPSFGGELARPRGFLCWLPSAAWLRDSGEALFIALDRMARRYGIRSVGIGSDTDRLRLPGWVHNSADLGHQEPPALLACIRNYDNFVGVTPYDPRGLNSPVAAGGVAGDRGVILRRHGLAVVSQTKFCAVEQPRYWDALLGAVFEAPETAVIPAIGPWREPEVRRFIENGVMRVRTDAFSLELFLNLWNAADLLDEQPNFVVPPPPPPLKLRAPFLKTPPIVDGTDLEARGRVGSEEYRSLLMSRLPSGAGGQRLLGKLREQAEQNERYLTERGL